MNNPQTQITLGTNQRMKRNNPKNTTHKTKKMSNTDPHQKPGINTGAREGLALPVSYKTPAVLLIVSSSVKVLLVIEEGRKNYAEGKRSIVF